MSKSVPIIRVPTSHILQEDDTGDNRNGIARLDDRLRQIGQRGNQRLAIRVAATAAGVAAAVSKCLNLHVRSFVRFRAIAPARTAPTAQLGRTAGRTPARPYFQPLQARVDAYTPPMPALNTRLAAVPLGTKSRVRGKSARSTPSRLATLRPAPIQIQRHGARLLASKARAAASASASSAAVTITAAAIVNVEKFPAARFSCREVSPVGRVGTLAVLRLLYVRKGIGPSVRKRAGILQRQPFDVAGRAGYVRTPFASNVTRRRVASPYPPARRRRGRGYSPTRAAAGHFARLTFGGFLQVESSMAHRTSPPAPAPPSSPDVKPSRIMPPMRSGFIGHRVGKHARVPEVDCQLRHRSSLQHAGAQCAAARHPHRSPARWSRVPTP